MSFGNLKVGARLGLGFGLVLVLLSAVAFIGITRLGDMDHAMQKLATDNYPKT
ncbi:MAG: MCP four helix bundle domain-containing protein, partial [Betaproteobacteria bacterium]|nr:MCP four helix bundle domain-containing protein [Betaproteobacteria bacterium]